MIIQPTVYNLFEMCEVRTLMKCIFTGAYVCRQGKNTKSVQTFKVDYHDELSDNFIILNKMRSILDGGRYRTRTCDPLRVKQVL